MVTALKLFPCDLLCPTVCLWIRIVTPPLWTYLFIGWHSLCSVVLVSTSSLFWIALLCVHRDILFRTVDSSECCPLMLLFSIVTEPSPCVSESFGDVGTNLEAVEAPSSILFLVTESLLILPCFRDCSAHYILLQLPSCWSQKQIYGILTIMECVSP